MANQMDDQKSKPGYWAVIPASVRYDQQLPANGKLLYAEITALASKDGYCWADTQFFSDNFELTPRTVNRLLEKLEALNYIQVETVRKGNQNKAGQRRIWIDQDAFALLRSGQKCPEREKNDVAQDKIVRAQDKIVPTTLNNNKNNNTSTMHVSDHKPERFEGFWSFYKSVTPKGVPIGAKQRALKAWNKLQPTDSEIAAMGKALKAQAAGERWQRGIGIPNASTWLNQRRWEDDAETGTAGAPESRETEVPQW